MKNAFKKISCIVICAVLICSQASLFVFAADDNSIIPHIDIRGFMNAAIYADMNDPDSEQLWPLETSNIIKTVAKVLPSLTKFAVDRNYDKLTESLIPYVNELFRPLMCDERGEPYEVGSGAYLYYPTREEVLENPDIDFTYDWRIDPYKSAERLNNFVNYLTDELGFGQVVIESHSNGSVVTMTYLAVYGTQKVKSIVLSAGAIYGTGFSGELVKGNLVIDNEGLETYLLSAFDNNQRAQLLSGLMDILAKAGIVSTLSDFANDLIDNSRDLLFKKTIRPIFGNWLNIWGMVPDDDVEPGKAYLFGKLAEDEDTDYSYMLERIDAFTDDIRANRDTYLQKINDECNLYVFCFYGYTGLPLTKDWNVMSDGVLMSKDSSLGAAFKNPSSTEIFEAGKYVSPDGKVDGSTAMFKDQTWYFKNCRHSLKNDFLSQMAKDLLYYDGQATTETFEEYPQFLIFDRVSQTIVPDVETAEPVSLTFFQKIIEFFKNIFSKIFNF